MTNVGSLRRTIAGRPARYSPERVQSISYFLEKHLKVGLATKPGLPPQKPGRLKRLSRLDRVFVAFYIAYWLILSLIFAGSTATILEALAGLYRALETVRNAIL